MKPHPCFVWAGTQTEMLPSPLSAGLLLSFRFPALWEALPGASGLSQPEIHLWSKQALIVSSWSCWQLLSCVCCAANTQQKSPGNSCLH